MTLNDDAASNRIALVVQLYADWRGWYMLRRVEFGRWQDVRPLSRDEALTYRTRPSEALELKWPLR
jgi:hypothetical protein